MASDGAWTVDDWRYEFNERAGIAEFDGGMSREAAELLAFQHCVRLMAKRGDMSRPEAASRLRAMLRSTDE